MLGTASVGAQPSLGLLLVIRASSLEDKLDIKQRTTWNPQATSVSVWLLGTSLSNGCCFTLTFQISSKFFFWSTLNWNQTEQEILRRVVPSLTSLTQYNLTQPSRGVQVEANHIKCKPGEGREEHGDLHNLPRDRDTHARAVSLGSNVTCQPDTVKSWELRRREWSHCSFYLLWQTIN